MSHGIYLDCGCYIDENSTRHWCPSCTSTPARPVEAKAEAGEQPSWATVDYPGSPAHSPVTVAGPPRPAPADALRTRLEEIAAAADLAGRHDEAMRIYHAIDRAALREGAKEGT